MANQVMELPRYSDDPTTYRRIWMRAKRVSSPDFRKRESEKTRRWQKKNPVVTALNQYRQTARKKGHAFAITVDMFERLILSVCHYCGAAAEPVNGIDRINNAFGYE